jgi:hypothetical protein
MTNKKLVVGDILVIGIYVALVVYIEDDRRLTVWCDEEFRHGWSSRKNDWKRFVVIRGKCR